jgi:hypothetical protein
MANMKIEQIEGIGPSYAEKLRAAEVSDTDTLLEIGCTKDGRQGLAQKTGISESQILKWVNMVDLCRIKGVGEEYSELWSRSTNRRNSPVEPLARKRSRAGLPKQRRYPRR